MEPEIVERPSMLLAGVVNCGKVVADVDIHGLWDAYMKSEPGIANRIDGAWYELHVGSKPGRGIYSITAGAEISALGALPIEVCLKLVPAGKYAHFVHRMKDGGFTEAFAEVEAWEKRTSAMVRDFGLQLFDREFDMKKPESLLHIYIPLA